MVRVSVTIDRNAAMRHQLGLRKPGGCEFSLRAGAKISFRALGQISVSHDELSTHLKADVLGNADPPILVGDPDVH